MLLRLDTFVTIFIFHIFICVLFFICIKDSISKSSDSSNVTTNEIAGKHHLTTSNATVTSERPKGVSKISERAKKKSWYSVLYPSYKSRSEDFKKLFKGVPDDERLVVGKYCCDRKNNYLLEILLLLGLFKYYKLINQKNMNV